MTMNPPHRTLVKLLLVRPGTRVSKYNAAWGVEVLHGERSAGDLAVRLQILETARQRHSE